MHDPVGARDGLARWKAEFTIYTILLILGASLVVVNYEIYYGKGGSALIATLGADAEWALAAAGIYLVVFELRRQSRDTQAGQAPSTGRVIAHRGDEGGMAEPAQRPVQVQVAVESMVRLGRLAAIVGSIIAAFVGVVMVVGRGTLLTAPRW